MIGVLGDSFMLQSLDAIACDLRRRPSLGGEAAAGFLDWKVVHDSVGRFDEDRRPLRYRWAGPHGSAAGGEGIASGGAGIATGGEAMATGGEGHGATSSLEWFVLSQQYYSRGELTKLLAVADVAIVNYGLHYCQPVRPGADERCHASHRRYEAEMAEVFSRLQAHAESGAHRASVFIETSAQHFPTISLDESSAQFAGGRAIGSWELRSFFPRLGPQPPAACSCAPTGRGDAPMRTRLVRNLSRSFPKVGPSTKPRASPPLHLSHSHPLPSTITPP